MLIARVDELLAQEVDTGGGMIEARVAGFGASVRRWGMMAYDGTGAQARRRVGAGGCVCHAARQQ